MLSNKEKDEKLWKMLDRIKRSPDGADLIEYLESVSQANYQAFKRCLPDSNERHKGYGNAVDDLVTLMKESAQKLENMAVESTELPVQDDGSPANPHA